MKCYKRLAGALRRACIVGAVAAAVTSWNASAATVTRGFIPLGDGAQLNYVLTLPDGSGPFPVALTYGPYSEGYNTASNLPQIPMETWMAQGYAHLGVSFRGTGCSSGTFQPFNGQQWGGDGAAAVEWAAAQPWSNGNVGMYGLSFPGTSQLATAQYSHSGHLKAIAPYASFPDLYRDLAYPGGIYSDFVPLWIAAGRQYVAISQGPGQGLQPAPDCEANLPLYVGANSTPAVQEDLHPYMDDYYANQPEYGLQNIDVPVLGCVAWQDTTVLSRSFEMYQHVLDPARTWLVTNNGAHGNCARSSGVAPPDGVTPLLKFFERYVKGVDNGWEHTPHVQVWHEVDNNNKDAWTSTFPSWADVEAQVTPVALYTHAGGRLDQSLPSAAETPDSYLFPAPTANTPGDWMGQSPYSHPVLPDSTVTYTTPALAQDAEFFGTGSADLWISSSASDTQIQIMLSEVRPDGQEMYVQNGWLQVSKRKLDDSRATSLLPVMTFLQADAQPLTAGQPVLARIELMPLDHVFRAGSSIRLSIDAPGSWLVPAGPATNMLYHEPGMVSQLTLGWLKGNSAQAPLPDCGTLLNQPCRANKTAAPAGQLAIAATPAVVATTPSADTAAARSRMGGVLDLRGLLPLLGALLLRLRRARWHLRSVFVLCAMTMLAGCGRSSPPATSAAGLPAGSSDLGACTTDVATDATLIPALVPDTAAVERRQRAADQFGGGFRVGGNPAEIGYIHYLADQLRGMGAIEVTEEPYTFTSWMAKPPTLEVLNGDTLAALPVAYFIPSSGNTGPGGLTADVTYLSALADVNFLGAVYTALAQQTPEDASLAVQSALQNDIGGGISLAQAIASASVSGKIVIYDAPKLPLPIGAFEAIATYYNNTGGTMGPLTPYTRPFVNELITVGIIDKALAGAGAAGVIAVLDYPAIAADNSYAPFGGLTFPSVPGIYLDHDNGELLKQQIVAAGVTPPQVRLTLDATENDQAVSYNISALIPGACTNQILLSSHTDGPNSIEDNGPAVILSMADYFLHAPASQRRRGVRIVFSGGHFMGGGLGSYIAAHQAELTANVLSVIEIEHIGAREWQELTPGVMGLDGLPEPLVLYAGAGSVQQDENVVFAKKFDRSIVTLPLPFGEGGAWASTAGLPKTQIISGPVYLLNGPFPQVSDEFTDYDLEQRQMAALIQMVLNLNTQTAQTLRNDSNFPNLP